MAHYVLKTESGPPIRLSPVGFRKAARDFLKCYHLFEEQSERFSIVPFFLCCRAIELALKALHLETSTQEEVRNHYWHDILKAYQKLPEGKRFLTPQDEDLLSQASEIYKEKHFEYFHIPDAVKKFQRFPDLQSLAKLAEKIVGLT